MYSKTYHRRGGILGGVLIFPFFVIAVGLPFVLLEFTDFFSLGKTRNSGFKPRKLQKLESEARKKRENPNTTNLENQVIDEDLKLAGTWKKHYSEIENRIQSLIDKKYVIDNDTKFEKAFSQYDKIEMLAQMYETHDFAEKIDAVKKENLAKFRKSLGDFLSEYKKGFVLDKVDALVNEFMYDKALNYLRDVLEGKRIYDMPPIFIKNKYSGVAGVGRKDRELEEYWFDNKTSINAAQDFKLIYDAYVTFIKTDGCSSALDFNFSESLTLLQKLDEFFISFIVKYPDKYEVETVYASIEKCAKNFSTLILSKLNNLLIILEETTNFNESQEMIKIISDFKNNFSIVAKYMPDLNKQIWKKFGEIKLESVNPIQIFSFDVDKITERQTQLKTHLNATEHNVSLTLDDISTSSNSLSTYVSQVLELQWNANNLLKNENAEAQNLTEVAESKIFSILYDAFNSSKFDNRIFKRDYIAWTIIFKLIWKPGKSRFGTNLEKLLSKQVINASSENYSAVLNIINAISPMNDQESAIYDFVGFNWDFKFEVFKHIKDYIESLTNGISQEFQLSFNKFAKSLCNELLRISKLDGVFENKFLKDLLVQRLKNIDKVYNYLLSETQNKYLLESERKSLAKFMSILTD